MSQSIGLLDLSSVSAGVVTARRGVTFAGAQVAAAGAKILGIAQHSATAAGQTLLLRVKGTAICEAGAAVAVGDAVAMDSVGRVVTAAALAVAAGATAVTSAAANGATAITGGEPPQYVLGDALQAATAAGQSIEILLRR